MVMDRIKNCGAKFKKGNFFLIHISRYFYNKAKACRSRNTTKLSVYYSVCGQMKEVAVSGAGGELNCTRVCSTVDDEST